VVSSLTLLDARAAWAVAGDWEWYSGARAGCAGPPMRRCY